MQNQIPILQTERLALRPFTLADAKEVQRMAGSAKIAQTTATIPHPYLDGMAEEWISKHQEWFEKGYSVAFAIELKNTNQLIGNISIEDIDEAHQKAEVGYWIGEDFWGQGYCTEALIQVIRYAFEVKKLNKLVARYMASNVASGAVMLKAGMVQEGILKQDFFKNGQFHNKVICGILKADYDLRK